MATWQVFEDSAPEMAAIGSMLLGRNEGIVYLATVRRDGSPQVHPVMPYVWNGRLWIFIVEFSSKYGDLIREGRYAFHAGPGGEAHEEFHLSGRATVNSDKTIRTAIASSAGIVKEEWERLFELSIERALVGVWSGWGTPQIRPTFTRWNEHTGVSILGPEPRASITDPGD